MTAEEQKVEAIIEKYRQFTPVEFEEEYSTRCALNEVEGIIAHRVLDLDNPDITIEEVDSEGMIINEINQMRKILENKLKKW